MMPKFCKNKNNDKVQSAFDFGGPCSMKMIFQNWSQITKVAQSFADEIGARNIFQPIFHFGPRPPGPPLKTLAITYAEKPNA